MIFKPERSIYLNGDISAETSMEAMGGISKLHSTDQKSVITLFIASSGGSVSDAFALYDYMMRVLKPRLQTVALGEVNSMAVMLFLMGEPRYRYIGRLAVMRFHRFSMTSSVSINKKNGLKIVQDLNRSETHYINTLMSRTGGKISRKKANTLLDDNVDVTAIEAVKLGLAHHIL